MKPMIIASYPRSGSTWLRFILCNLFYPGGSHDFDSVNRHIPSIDDPDGMAHAVDVPIFFKTHGLKHSQRILFLHRHVGDALVSEWWYKRKYHSETRTLEDYLKEDDYGAEWRAHINHYFPCEKSIDYRSLGNPARVHILFPHMNFLDVARAVNASSFEAMQKAEEKGFGSYPVGDPEIKFVRKGVNDQWRELDVEIQHQIQNKNLSQLKMLRYL